MMVAKEYTRHSVRKMQENDCRETELEAEEK